MADPVTPPSKLKCVTMYLHAGKLSAIFSFLFFTITYSVLHEAFCSSNVYWIAKKNRVPKDLFSVSTAEASKTSNG